MESLSNKVAQLRRDHIVAAAIEVFAAKGYHRATIRDVAKLAGVADGTIYASFESKAALLLAMFEPLEKAADQEKPAAPDFAAFLRDELRNRFAGFSPRALDALRVILSEALVDQNLRQLVLNALCSRPSRSLYRCLMPTSPRLCGW